jgi:bacterioferritin
VASNWPVWLPGSTLKQIAITEMKHAEAIIERVVVLGGEPATEPSPITVGTTIEEMLALDREQEREAIELYRRIIGVARDEGDDVTMNLFEQILSDEQAHHRTFSDLIEED